MLHKFRYKIHFINVLKTCFTNTEAIKIYLPFLIPPPPPKKSLGKFCKELAFSVTTRGQNQYIHWAAIRNSSEKCLLQLAVHLEEMRAINILAFKSARSIKNHLCTLHFILPIKLPKCGAEKCAHHGSKALLCLSEHPIFDLLTHSSHARIYFFLGPKFHSQHDV